MPRLFYAVAIFAVTAVFFLTIRAYGTAEYKRGISDGKLQAANDFIIGKEELDKIRNARPDLVGRIKRLRDGSF